jgi:LmbE family N-acetylglucosaminyl deacetylase
MEADSDLFIENTACAVIVAHPDDETLWAGGTILMHPANQWTIITVCRKSDPDRQPKFFAALDIYHATGAMGDLDDGPEQIPLALHRIQETILSLLPQQRYDLILTHSPRGEYTRHRRHEETAEAVIGLVESGRLRAKQLRLFAYEDGNRAYVPRSIRQADQCVLLPEDIWNEKYRLITKVYQFQADSWEARTTPRSESFWTVQSVHEIHERIQERSMAT